MEKTFYKIKKMRTQSSDTNPEVEKILIKMLQEKTISQRISKSLSLTSNTIYLSKRAISRANPGKTKSDLDILFVKYHYGNKLADQLKNFLEKTKNV
ncbi:MAG: hypothetical protein M3R36_13175 [Bacteroidota bacterium]|nr:hypothetical protein [Bacteroidota bacterium]